MNKIVQIDSKKINRNKLVGIIAAYFKVNKALLQKETDTTTEVFDITVNSSFQKSLYVVTISSLRLEDFMNYNRFIKSEMHAEFINGEGQATGNYLMVMILHDELFAVHRGYDFYSGFGGCFIKDPTGSGFVIEPLKNYLDYKYPQIIRD